MILKYASYDELVKKIKLHKKKIAVYGAGMIGQILVSDIIKRFNLYNELDCYIDMDDNKIGQMIFINNRSYKINSLDYLKEIDENYVILISNSNFYQVVEYLDGLSNLDNTESYILPIIQIFETNRSDSIYIKKITGEPMIPKKIHYCWFGKKEIPVFLKKCINTWREFCPDYEIICWDESNFDVRKYRFAEEAYEKGKYGFVSDLARLDILYEHGGLFFDTDVSLLKRPDDLLYQLGFVGVEKWGNINTGGGCGFVPKHPMLKELIDYRKSFSFIKQDGSLNVETNGMYETIPFIKCGMRLDNSLQIIKDVTIYPSYVFHPYDYMSCETCVRDVTISKHHFNGGWMEEKDKLNREKTQSQYQDILRRMRNCDNI